LTIGTLGVAASVPTSSWVSRLVFRKIGLDEEGVAAASKKISQYNHYIWIGIALLLVGAFVWQKLKKRGQASRSPTGPVGPASGPPIEPPVGPTSAPSSMPGAASAPEPVQTPTAAGLPPRSDVG